MAIENKIQEIQLGSTVHEIQPRSVENRNTAEATLLDKYDWVGTIEQYQQQEIAERHSDWVCYITNDIKDGQGALDLSDYVKKLDYNEDMTDVVHKSENETITGVKSFTENTEIKKSTPLTVYNNEDVDTTSTVSGTKYSGVCVTSDNNEELGYFRHAFHTDNNINYSSAEMVAIDPDPSHTQGVDRVNSILAVTTNGITSSANLYCDQLTSSSTASTQIPTMGWINDATKSTNVVHRVDDEQISGRKTFTAGGHTIIIRRGTATTWTDIKTEKADGTRTGGFRNILDNSNNNETNMYVTSNDGSTIKGSIAVITDGTNAWTAAPASDVVNSIVTTKEILKNKNGYVKLGNGIIIQWGVTPTITAQGQFVTLPTAFTTANYSVTANMNFSNGSNHCSCYDLETTGFKMRVGAGGYQYNFVAVGY